jgi:hypothetical protein
MVRPSLLFDFDLEDDEFGRSEVDTVIAREDGDLAREHALGKLRKIERCRIPARTTAESRRDGSGHEASLSGSTDTTAPWR